MRSSLVRAFTICAAIVLLFGCATGHARGEDRSSLEFRWVYLADNLQVKENLPRIELVLRRAAKCGYNGVVLADYKLNILDRVPDHYFQNAEKLKSLCKELSLEIVPCVMPFGYSSGILAHDPNLAEGLPARDVPFIIRQRRAELAGENKNLVPGDFENSSGHSFAGWSFQDAPGKGTFADSQVVHGGRTSLRIENPPSIRGNRRVNKRISVRPWTQYHASVWMKTAQFESAPETRMFALSPKGRALSHSNLGVKRDQDWTLHHAVFNSLDNREIQFYIGAWDCGAGKLWADDAVLIEEPFVNLIRRPDCPLVVRTDSGTTLAEGKDYRELRDTKMGTNPWAGEFDVYHKPPVLEFAADAGVREGDKIFVSYFHAVTIYDNQVPCSLSDPKVFEVVEDQVKRVDKLFSPKTFMLSHDEIRVANWSERERKGGKTAGELLADNVRRCTEIIRKTNPEARMVIWSDMFDPHHNATKDHYLVNGDLAGSWEGLPANMMIMNWNSGKPEQSLRFFADRGHPQILAGYYDAPPAKIRDWLRAAGTTSRVRGVMYTTWQQKYSDLEPFARAAWGE